MHLPLVECPVDLDFVFQPIETPPVMPEEGYWEINRFYAVEMGLRRVYHCPTRTLPPYACVTWLEGNPKTVRCDYVQGMESYMNYSHNICDLLGLETLLLEYEGLLLHASFIRWQGKGILFSAPSGTGKSTQADLWEKYESAEILNGDRAGLRCLDGRWTAFGLPLAGSSCIYRNENAPVEAVIALRQGKENRIRRLGPAEAFRFLYPEITVHHWDKGFVEKASGLLLKLLQEVPVYLLECRPDKEAVRLLRDTVLKETGKGNGYYGYGEHSCGAADYGISSCESGAAAHSAERNI